MCAGWHLKTYLSLTNFCRPDRNHVFSDLQPYTCTFEHCPSPFRLFPTRREWMEHEMSQHRRKWVCVFCQQPDSALSSQEAMANHIRTHHGDTVTKCQLPLILEACEQDQKHFPSTSCPLCESWQSVPGKETPSCVYNAHPFYRHLGHHQQLLALDALPLYIEGLEINTEDDDGEMANEDLDSEPEDSDTGDSAEISLSGPIARSSLDSDVLGQGSGCQLM